MREKYDLIKKKKFWSFIKKKRNTFLKYCFVKKFELNENNFLHCHYYLKIIIINGGPEWSLILILPEFEGEKTWFQPESNETNINNKKKGWAHADLCSSPAEIRTCLKWKHFWSFTILPWQVLLYNITCICVCICLHFLFSLL